MPELETAPSDMLRELRLRRWARTNYVGPANRDNDSWHPIVLDEMRLKDGELEETADHQAAASRFVPLAPNVHYAVHQCHADFTKLNHADVVEPGIIRQNSRIWTRIDA